MHDPGRETVEELYRCAHRSAFGLLRDATASEDIAQEATARALARWERVAPYAMPWVSRVAVNLVFGRARTRRPTPVDTVPDTVGPAVEREPSIDLVRALGSLPTRQREVVVLRYLQDWKQDEVAQALGCSVGAVRQHASRGLARLRLELGADYLTEKEGSP